MCLILFAYQAHPKYSYIVASNRDEFYQRPTAQAAYWQDEPTILAGRDLEKMGTWMGVSKSGRFAALTNYRDPKEEIEGKQSRGELVADYLKGKEHPEVYLSRTVEKSGLYPGYNLLAGTSNELFYHTNIGNKVQRVAPGIHGLSNHLLNTNWPKVNKGKRGLKEIVQTPMEDKKMVESLFALLQNADQAPDELLPKTGVPLELERMLSPMFIKSEGYGTRCSTVLLMNEKNVHYFERTYEDGEVKDCQYFIEF